VSRPALGPTQPPVQWVPGVLSPGLKRGRGVTLTTHPIYCWGREWVGAILLSSQAPSWRSFSFFITSVIQTVAISELLNINDNFSHRISLLAYDLSPTKCCLPSYNGSSANDIVRYNGGTNTLSSCHAHGFTYTKIIISQHLLMKWLLDVQYWLSLLFNDSLWITYCILFQFVLFITDNCINLFAIHLSSQTVGSQRRTIEWLMNDELERSWNDGGTKENHRSLSRG
jgi:hypothetical protein